MGILKTKPILLHNSFQNHDNAFNVENSKLKDITAKVLPSLESDVQLDRGQQVFYSMDLMLNKLLDNDRFIENYYEKVHEQSLSVQQLSASFKQDVDFTESTAFETRYAEHLQQYHTDLCGNMQLSVIEKNYLRSDFSNFKEAAAAEKFLKTFNEQQLSAHDEVSVANDIVVETEYHDSPTVKSPTNYILVSVANKNTNYEFKYMMTNSQLLTLSETAPNTRDSTYIYKRWLSGLKEIYVYIPSTFTQYVENPQDTDLKDRVSFIQLKLNRHHFDLHHLYSMHICGQNAPMLIHSKDKSYFNDIMQPSIVRTMCWSSTAAENVNCIYDEATNLYTLCFSCCGTDAQAIRIIAD